MILHHRQLLTSLLLSSRVTLASPDFSASRYLWYTSPAPATDWENGALPIGNGRLAATIYGGVRAEVVTLNENTIWSGPLQERTPENALAALPIARELLLNGSITEAGEFIQREMMHEIDSMRAYSYFGNLELGFGHDEAKVEGYKRWLDTRKGDVGVEYVVEGVKYTREYIASYPAGVLAARFTASEKGALKLKATFSRVSDVMSLQASASDTAPWIRLSGTSGQPAEEDPIVFTGQASFVAEGAHFTSSNGTLTIVNATTIDILFDAETNYRYPDQDAIDAEIARKLTDALNKGYDRIKDEALADSSSLLDRASIDLGKSTDETRDLATDERIALVRSAGELDGDPELATLAWNYGRHLLVASSRNTSETIDLPANLQGIWNNQTTAAWGGKYTININTEMNYWPAGPTNLIETQEPLFDLFAVAYPRGQKLAKDMYNCSGVVFHHNLDVWGDPAPVDNYTSSSMWPMGAAWLATHLYDQYRFTGDKVLLADTIYPYLVDVAKFYQCYTFEHEGYKVTGPSLSPENTFVIPENWTIAGNKAAMDVAIPMDDQIIWEVLHNLLDAASELGITDNDHTVSAAKSFLHKIHPPRIGSQGQIQEWRLDYKSSAPGHRHLSPLFGVHPGRQFSPLVNSTLSAAAEILLDDRLSHGSGSTGWSNAWFINQYARLYRGNDAWAQIEKWFSLYPTDTLWNTDDGATFQIDGNFGVLSGITEMLLQSHAGVVHLLPALPGIAVPRGSARGLTARGGFEVDIDWEDGRLQTAVIRSLGGGTMRVRVQDWVEFFVNGEKYEEGLETEEGEEYVVTLGR
ncbi:Six-hairpin glycosidase-like protein [Aspergillus spinulosporus]